MVSTYMEDDTQCSLCVETPIFVRVHHNCREAEHAQVSLASLKWRNNQPTNTPLTTMIVPLRSGIRWLVKRSKRRQKRCFGREGGKWGKYKCEVRKVSLQGPPHPSSTSFTDYDLLADKKNYWWYELRSKDPFFRNSDSRVDEEAPCFIHTWQRHTHPEIHRERYPPSAADNPPAPSSCRDLRRTAFNNYTGKGERYISV